MAWAEKQRSGKYAGKYRDRHGVSRSVGTFARKSDARNAASAQEAAAQKPGWRDPKAAQRTWGEWCETWWESRGVEPGTLSRDRLSRDAALLPKWGNTPLADITRFDVKEWATSLRKQGMAPRTVQKRVYLLSASLNAAIDAEILTVNPAFRIKIATGQVEHRRYLTRPEADALLSTPLTPLDHTVINTLFGTGMRWGEMVGLQVGRVDFGRMQIRVAESWDTESGALKAYSKGGSIRVVPIPWWLAPPLHREIGDRKEGFVFLRRGYRLHYSNWRKQTWLPAVKASGLEHVRIHDTRHTFASWHLQGGTTLAEVGQLLGHSSSQTTSLYAHLADEFKDSIRHALPAPGER